MIEKYIKRIILPKKDSRKGDNGKVLVIGGSRLFHAASCWSATMAAKMLDMVHFSSPCIENNDLMRKKAKELFWDGIVVEFDQIEHYINEDDCILIGPGMERGEETRELINTLLRKYPDKKWIIDGGALQEVDPNLIKENMIITPNFKEQDRLKDVNMANPTVLAKGVVDHIYNKNETVEIEGGNPGMTKGGTGDVLAGIVAGFFAKSDAMAACVVASYVNKQAGDALLERFGTFYSANDLIKSTQIELKNLFYSGI